MNKALMGCIVAGLFAEHVEGETVTKGATVASLTKDKPLSGVIIKAFFDGSDAKKVQEKVAQSEGSRLQYLMRTFPQTEVQGIKTAVKEYKEMAAKETGGDSKEARKVTTTRAGEVQSLYGAWKFLGFKPDGLGYHDAVSKAREGLRLKGIRWAGDRIPEKWERDVRKEVERDAQAELAARMEIERTERETGTPLDADAEEAIREKAKAEAERADMIALARGLHKKYGSEKCGFLVDALEATISAEDQDAANKAATKKEARAA